MYVAQAVHWPTVHTTAAPRVYNTTWNYRQGIVTTTSPWVAPLLVAGATATVITLGVLASRRRRVCKTPVRRRLKR